jgi:hypothetical protein
VPERTEARSLADLVDVLSPGCLVVVVAIAHPASLTKQQHFPKSKVRGPTQLLSAQRPRLASPPIANSADKQPAVAHELLAGPMRARAARLLAQLEGIKRKHRGEAGRRREDDVREFLDDFLPGRLAVSGGEIVATDGSISPQMDLIVYDRLETPLIDRSESSVVVPIEGVCGVIEVSTRLDGSKMADDVA